MTTLTYIPNRHYYQVDDVFSTLMSVELIKSSYASFLSHYLHCPEWIAQDIQNTLDSERLCPLYIVIKDDRVYYFV